MENLKKCNYFKNLREVENWIHTNKDDTIFKTELIHKIIETSHCLVEAINSHLDGRVIEIDGLNSKEINIKFFRKRASTLMRHELSVYLDIVEMLKKIYELYHHGDRIDECPHWKENIEKNASMRKTQTNN